MAKAVAANAKTLKARGVAILQVKGDRDRPEGNRQFAKHLDGLGIANKFILLKDTPHDLGLYYERSGEQMMRFLARHLRRAP